MNKINKYALLMLIAMLFSGLSVSAEETFDEVTLQYKEEFEGYSVSDIPNWEIDGNAEIVKNGNNMLLKIGGVSSLQKQFGKLNIPFVAEFKVKLPENGTLALGFVNSKFYVENFMNFAVNNSEGGVTLPFGEVKKISVVVSNKTAFLYVDDVKVAKNAFTLDGIRGMDFKFSDGGELDDVYAYSGETLLSSYDIMPFEDKFDTKLNDSVVLLVGSDEALVQGQFKRIDNRSSEVKPVVLDDRTYVPLRFVAEAFGVSLDWEEETNKITLKGGNNTVNLTVGEASITVNGETKLIDAASYITDDRTMVPIRAVSEALGKYVFWDDSGLIVIADENKFPEPQKTVEKALIAKLVDKMYRTSIYQDSDGVYTLAKELIGDEVRVKTVTASTHDGNIPENTIDGNLNTRWSAEYEQWIMFDLGEEGYIDNVAIAWSNGAARKAVYDLYVSSDGENWTQVFTGKSSGVTNDYEITSLKTSFRYLKYAGHGNSSTGWNSITEINFFEN